jgi:hypothetical protein
VTGVAAQVIEDACFAATEATNNVDDIMVTRSCVKIITATVFFLILTSLFQYACASASSG